MNLKDLPTDDFVWRLRFAFLPVDRWESYGDKDQWRQANGKYWWRIVFEVRAGLIDEWTAYSHYNDNLNLGAT